MKLITLAALCVLSITPLSAAQYTSVSLGSNDVCLTNEDHSPKIGYHSGMSYGYKFENGMRAELEVSFSKCNFKTKYNMKSEDEVESKEYRSFHSWSYMANTIYDVVQLNFRDVVPYFGVGVGYADNTEKSKIKSDFETSQDKYHDSRFAYQVILGAKCAINADYETALQYNFLSGQSHAKTHNIGLYLIRNF